MMYISDFFIKYLSILNFLWLFFSLDVHDSHHSCFIRILFVLANHHYNFVTGIAELCLLGAVYHDITDVLSVLVLSP